MKQPVSSVFSDFFVNNLFELNGYACKCDKDTNNVIPGEPPETTLVNVNEYLSHVTANI